MKPVQNLLDIPRYGSCPDFPEGRGELHGVRLEVDGHDSLAELGALSYLPIHGLAAPSMLANKAHRHIRSSDQALGMNLPCAFYGFLNGIVSKNQTASPVRHLTPKQLD